MMRQTLNPGRRYWVKLRLRKEISTCGTRWTAWRRSTGAGGGASATETMSTYGALNDCIPPGRQRTTDAMSSPGFNSLSAHAP
jgi:hypothetical protein